MVEISDPSVFPAIEQYFLAYNNTCKLDQQDRAIIQCIRRAFGAQTPEYQMGESIV